jgi:hypothetical protein
VALERQENQLAAHLEKRRRQLVAMRDEAREARSALRAEREAHQRRVNRTSADLEGQRRELAAGRQEVRADRRRLADLYRRLKRRYARHWKLKQADLERREKELAAERDRLERDRAGHADAVLRFNGEVELGRREVEDGRRELSQAQRGWAERHDRERAELRCRATDLAGAEQDLADQRQLWEERRRHLEAEVEGLETRARNLRRKVEEQQALSPAAILEPPPVTPARSPVPPEPIAREERLTVLEALAGDLADQRRHLLEQGERLALLREEWRQEHAAALADVLAAAARVEGRERELLPREQALEQAEGDLRRRRAEAARRHADLDAWQAHLTVRQAAWESERDSLLEQSHVREQRAQRHLRAVAELRRLWGRRYRQGLEALRAEVQHCQESRRQYAAAWQECLNRGTALDQQERDVAQRALALEQHRLEALGKSPNSAAAEKRLRRLRRRCAAPTASAERKLTGQRRALAVEAQRLAELSRRLHDRTAALARGEADLSARLAEWEQRQVDADAAASRRDAEVESLLVQRRHHERQLQALRDEVERLARLLIDDDPTLLPIPQAA